MTANPWNWLWANKEWFFSGIGVLCLGLLGKILAGRRNSEGLPSATTVNTVSQNPIINISVPQQPQGVTTAAVTPEPPPVSGSKTEQDPRPRFETLAPRITFVMPDEVELGGFVEGGDQFRAVLAVVRMYRPSSDAYQSFITARLRYRVKERVGLSPEDRILFDIYYGAWMDEQFNFVEMGLTDTKELLLALELNGSLLAVQDNRRSVEKRREFSYQNLPGDVPVYVDVTLTDEKYGNLISFTYEIQPSPLRVEPIIRVPRI